jgi:hypothetical protein
MTGPNVPATDYYGNLRNGVPDIGAIEYNGIPNPVKDVLSASAPKLGPSMLEVSPHPMQNTVTFEMAEILQADVSLAVFSAEGKLVHVYSGIGDRQQVVWNGLDLNGQLAKPGIYYYSIVIDGALYSGRIIKLK